MIDDSNFRHLGGGRKGLFLLLRYSLVAVQDRSRELSDLINATPHLNRLDTGKLEVELKEVDLADRACVPTRLGDAAYGPPPTTAAAPRGGALRPFRQFDGTARLRPPASGTLTRSIAPDGMPLAAPAPGRS